MYADLFHRLAAALAFQGIAFVTVLTACQKTPAPQTTQSVEGGATDKQQEENGVVTASFDPNSKDTQTLTAASDSALTGSSVLLPPGCLAIETAISVEEGSSLVSASLGAELGLGSVTLESSSPTLVVTNDAKVNAVTPFSLAIALPEAGLNLDDSFVVVVFRVYDAESQSYIVGIKPTSELSIKDGKVTFSTIYFGAYQIAMASSEITTAKQVATTTPFLKKNEEKQLSQPSWLTPTAQISAERKVTVKATLSGVEVVRCTMVADGDQEEPWDIVAESSLDLRASFDGPTEAFDVKVRFECLDVHGRVLVSDWSAVIHGDAPASTPAVAVNHPPVLTFTSVSATSVVRGTTINAGWAVTDSDNDTVSIAFSLATSGSGACDGSTIANGLT